MHELFWYGVSCGAAAAVFAYQVAQTCLRARLRVSKRWWRPGRYFALKRARIVGTGQAAMYACGGQILSKPYILGWRIVVPVTFDPGRVLGDMDDNNWMIFDRPDDIIPAADLTICTRDEYQRLDCDLETFIVYMRPPPPRDDAEPRRNPTPKE